MNFHYDTREAWLQAFAATWAPRSEGLGFPLPPVKVSCGWPSRGGLATARRRVGECWSHEASGEGYHEIFISPLLDTPLEALETLVHELGHAAVGTADGHGAKFRSYCKAAGLEGKPATTSAGPELRQFLEKKIAELGDYPHSQFRPPVKESKKSEKGRFLKVECPGCGYKIRTTKLWLLKGVPTCCCGERMEGPDFDADGM